MKVKTSELTGVALDWAVAKCELMVGQDYTLAIDTDFDGTKRVNFGGMYPEWSTDWQEAGPIIEREKIDLNYFPDGSYENGGAWMATRTDGPAVSEEEGPTSLIAAMRCYVASKFGDEMEVPDELA